jgi:hypothetical protein
LTLEKNIQLELFGGIPEVITFEQIEKYITYLSTNGVWTEPSLLSATANALEIKITIITTWAINKEVEVGDQPDPKKEIFLYFTAGHFQSLDDVG